MLSTAIIALQNVVGGLTESKISMLGLPNKGEALKQARQYVHGTDPESIEP